MKKIKIESIKNANLSPDEEKQFDKIIEATEQELSTKTKPVTIRFSISEIERIKKVAKKKGLPYQTYIKSILKQALDHDDAA